MNNVTNNTASLTEAEFKEHPVGKEFLRLCELMGIDLSKWEFAECEHDIEPYKYWNDTPPWRHGHVYYTHPELEDHTLAVDFNDDRTGEWDIDTLQITQD